MCWIVSAPTSTKAGPGMVTVSATCTGDGDPLGCRPPPSLFVGDGARSGIAGRATCPVTACAHTPPPPPPRVHQVGTSAHQHTVRNTNSKSGVDALPPHTWPIHATHTPTHTHLAISLATQRLAMSSPLRLWNQRFGCAARRRQRRPATGRRHCLGPTRATTSAHPSTTTATASAQLHHDAPLFDCVVHEWCGSRPWSCTPVSQHGVQRGGGNFRMRQLAIRPSYRAGFMASTGNTHRNYVLVCISSLVSAWWRSGSCAIADGCPFGTAPDIQHHNQQPPATQLTPVEQPWTAAPPIAVSRRTPEKQNTENAAPWRPDDGPAKLLHRLRL